MLGVSQGAIGGEVTELVKIEGVEPIGEFADFMFSGHGRKVTPDLLRARCTAWRGVTPAAVSLAESLRRRTIAS